ncbi:MAG: pentapeptide repeat-containing protein [Saprospiraceae bacterium]|nr:pentapeptide repeat-containing protein [Saprospiraceae bacterium]
MSDPNLDKPTKQTFNIGLGLAFFMVGALVGFAGLQFFLGKLPLLTEVLITASYLLFGLLIITFIIIFYFRNFLSKRLFGTSPKNVHTALEDTQRAANYVTDRIAEYVLKDAPPDIRSGVRSLLPRLAHQFFWSRMRNWWWQWILGMFVAIGGLTGTLLLMNQNALLQSQNDMISRQMQLEEANRRSALIVFLSNIIDKMEREIGEQQKGLSEEARNKKEYKLSESLIRQIATLSRSFKPYKFLEGDSLIKKPISPERGQLLINLMSLPLDSTTLQKIFKRGSFESADLRNVVFIEANLTGADLRSADLRGSDLSYANLSMALLSDAVLTDTDLRRANLQWSNLTGADFEGADLSRADLSKAIAINTHWKGADVSRANFEDANLSKAIFHQSNFTAEQAGSTASLYKMEGLPDSILDTLLIKHPQLFLDPDQVEQ